MSASILKRLTPRSFFATAARRSYAPILSLLLLSSCGGDDSPAGPDPDPDPDPVPADVGVPNGTPTTGTLGSAGGSLSSSDGAFSLTIPAGALATNTAITIQPITNKAGGGLGQGYRLTPDGLTFTTAIDITFEIADDALAVTAPEFLDGAVQLEDGRWGVLKSRVVDMGSRTLTCKTSHFSDYSMIAGVQIIPGTATVQASHTLGLHVTYCSRDVITDPGQDDLTALVISCDPDLAPLGTFTNWSVNGVSGGSGALGTVNSPDENTATYAAPASEPTPNPVAVSVQTNYNGMSALLVANVTVTFGERWEGTCTAEWIGGALTIQNMRWDFDPATSNGHDLFFRPSGTITQTALILPGAITVSFAPSTHEIEPSDGSLLIDPTTDPPTYSGGGGSFWELNACFIFPPEPGVICIDPFTGGNGWFVGSGEVTNGGTTIEGTQTNAFGTFTYSFTKVR